MNWQQKKWEPTSETSSPMLSQENLVTQWNKVLVPQHVTNQANNAVQVYLHMTTQLNSLLKTMYVLLLVSLRTGLQLPSRTLNISWNVLIKSKLVLLSHQALLGLSEAAFLSLFLLSSSCMLCETQNIFR